MSQTTRRRVARLEDTLQPSGRVVVLSCYTASELETKANAALASGEASPRDLIVLIRKFAGEDCPS
ncbi:hypothetical protein JNW90_30820 [Micromonospora sp. STR1s_5]|nr:hypothetical protein [Micromonospora sp. STR1s_5]